MRQTGMDRRKTGSHGFPPYKSSRGSCQCEGALTVHTSPATNLVCLMGSWSSWLLRLLYLFLFAPRHDLLKHFPPPALYPQGARRLSPFLFFGLRRIFRLWSQMSAFPCVRLGASKGHRALLWFYLHARFSARTGTDIELSSGDGIV